jgi:hypothetical protein
VIDPLLEKVIRPSVAARYYPLDERGRKVHVSTVYRHMTAGVRGVLLESIRTPKRCTSREAVARFFARLSARPATKEQAHPAVPRDCDSRIEEELDRLGL